MSKFLKKDKDTFSGTALSFLLLITVISAYLFLSTYHKETSRRFIQDFYAQNSAIISRGDSYELVYRLNSLSSVQHWKCISVEESGKVIFARNNSTDCNPGIFQSIEQVVVPENNKLKVVFTIEMPSSLKLLLGIFLLVQLSVLVLVVYIQKSEYLKREMLSQNWQRQISKTMAQVVHDIRSPLAALKFIAHDLNKNKTDETLSSKAKTLFVSSVKRVEGILQDLMISKKPDTELPSLDSEDSKFATSITQNSCSVYSILNDVVIEKEFLIRSLDKKIELITNIKQEQNTIEAQINSKELYRVLSNVINNAMESFDNLNQVISDFDGHQIIKIDLSLHTPKDSQENDTKTMARISIKDNGAGMSSQNLNKILTTGGTFKKNGGQGLGLSHALKVLSDVGGNIEIVSNQEVFDHGTEIIMNIPSIQQKQNQKITKSLGPINLAPLQAFQVVLIDDDKFLQEYWKMAAELIDIELVICQNLKELLEKNISKQSLVFIDKNLGIDINGMGVNGLDIAKSLNEQYGYVNLHLLTGEEVEGKSLPTHFLSSIKHKIFPKILIKNAKKSYDLEMNVTMGNQHISMPVSTTIQNGILN